MFWFCKPKLLNIDFFTTREDVFHNAKPKKASLFVPEWFKQMPKPGFDENPMAPLLLQKTIKTCPAFSTLYSSGFMLPLWSDLNIEVNSDSYRYQFIDGKSLITFHTPKQIAGCSFANTHIQMKLHNPWFMKTNEKINMLFMAPTWNNFGSGEIVVAPGSYYSYADPIEANINLFIKKHEHRVVHQLFFGQPLVHVVPITNRPIKLHYHLVLEDELEKLLAKSPLRLMELNRHRRAHKVCQHE